MTNTKSARIEWIYVAKMFGLLLVTLGHGLTTPVIRDFIYSFHMPLFFILSGILYKERTAKENLMLQLKRIIVPYLLINAIILMFYIAYLAMFGDFDIE